jgi:hypothetical protein
METRIIHHVTCVVMNADLHRHYVTSMRQRRRVASITALGIKAMYREPRPFEPNS